MENNFSNWTQDVNIRNKVKFSRFYFRKYKVKPHNMMSSPDAQPPKGRGPYSYRFQSRNGPYTWHAFSTQAQVDANIRGFGEKWERLTLLRVEPTSRDLCPGLYDVPPNERIGNQRIHGAVAAGAQWPATPSPPQSPPTTRSPPPSLSTYPPRGPPGRLPTPMSVAFDHQ